MLTWDFPPFRESSSTPLGAVLGAPESSLRKSPDELAILEDYADPFDVQETGDGLVGASGAPEKVPENDGYMEPYEAQKMMAEIRGSKETATQPLPLYDTPYEPEEEGATPEGEGAPWPRESRLPEDDERPPEEYDQPWEWKKERISKAFAGGQGAVYRVRVWAQEEDESVSLHHHLRRPEAGATSTFWGTGYI
ncbi:PREDICTED: SH2 domain-containing adapter protein F isoform X7 [Myotis brandtii]|uniref:SH2 domain-containing adapter protein F isoform X7 n=1 Tax=Myotis brandtii TaxID=109478 RepID=UPI00070462E2|nr:PREDICTED: SH2 domain-containing adapter protein F isoform X7 [Myotis brandtii]